VNARIVAVGAAAPMFRLPAAAVAEAWGRGGGRGQAALCAPDEDTLTLAWEAGSRALESAGLDAAVVDGLWWGTTRPPFAEGPSHSFLAGALGLAPESGGALLSGSTHSGIDALAAAADAIAAGSARIALVIASDALRPGPGTGAESRCGAGAAAIVLSADSGAGSIGARITRHHPVVDRYRGDADTETRDLYDGRLFREEIFLPIATAVIEPLATLEPRAWSLPDPDGRLGAMLAKRAGSTTPPSASVYAELGDTGAAAALLGAIGSLDVAGTIGVVAYGGGRATGVAVHAERPVPGATSVARVLSEGSEITYTAALRARGQLVAAGETIPMGVPPESAMFVRGADEMLGLLGGRCVDCGTISTPPSIHPHCVACGGPKLEPVSLARHGTVHTYVINYTMPAPFVAPLPLAVLDLDDGARLMLQVVGDGEELAIGRAVRLVLRRYSYERGVPVYGFKAKSIATEEGSV
jgi:hydroxymethylglutaryl-CoA synthase